MPCSTCIVTLDFVPTAVSKFSNICKWCYFMVWNMCGFGFHFIAKMRLYESSGELCYVLETCHSLWHFYIKIMRFLITYIIFFLKSVFFLFSLTVHVFLFCFRGTVYWTECKHETFLKHYFSGLRKLNYLEPAVTVTSQGISSCYLYILVEHWSFRRH